MASVSSSKYIPTKKVLLNMKKIAFLVVIAALIYGCTQEQGIPAQNTTLAANSSDSTLESAYRNRQSDLQIKGYGTVVKLLSDDLHGSRHQRFILRMNTGQTLLVAHNIDLAPRINGISVGDNVEFYGEYEWNSKGGVIHWTHRDPNGSHTDGWLKHNGHTYQ